MIATTPCGLRPGFTKGQMVDYYLAVAPAIVRHLDAWPGSVRTAWWRSWARPREPGRVIDWAENDRRRQMIALYSLRAASMPQVSTRVTWSEIEEALRRSDEARLGFGPAEVIERPAGVGDPFEAVARLRQRLPIGRMT